jgi:hypothetical protein
VECPPDDRAEGADASNAFGDQKSPKTLKGRLTLTICLSISADGVAGVAPKQQSRRGNGRG